MSDYYIGPFGRILPVSDRPSSEDESESSDKPSASHSHSYQLPPPHKSMPSMPLQLGTDTSLLQAHPSEPRPVLNLKNNTDRNQKNKEQLPPVSQLLTPASHSSLPASPYSPQLHGSTASSATSVSQHPIGDLYDNPTESFLRRNSEFASRTVSTSLLDSSSSQLRQHQQQSSTKLPPISQVGVDPAHNFRPEVQSHAAAGIDPPVAYYPHGQLAHHGSFYNKEGPRTGLPLSQWKGVAPHALGKSRTPPILPHVVDERYIEGEGLCYIYADGSHCPKSIDGEPVNANWGITKAGKPRKRLAQACIACREKKIKCQPNLPKCDQCQKSGRECRFGNA